MPRNLQRVHGAVYFERASSGVQEGGKMTAFHGDPAIKEKYLARIAKHRVRQADKLIELLEAV